MLDTAKPSRNSAFVYVARKILSCYLAFFNPDYGWQWINQLEQSLRFDSTTDSLNLNLVHEPNEFW